MCLSFQRWTRWVVRKRMQAAAASSSPLASRTPGCWRVSPSCSSWRRTLDKYSWASSRLLQGHHQLLCAVGNWALKKRGWLKVSPLLFLLFSFFSGSGLWGFWLCGRYAQSSFKVIQEAAWAQFLHAEGSRSRVWRPRLLSVSILSAQLPLKTSWNINWSSRKRRLYLMCNTLTQSLRYFSFLQTALQASFLNLHPHHPSWLMPLSLHSGQLWFLASVYIMNPLWKAQSGNSSCSPNIFDFQALHVPPLFFFLSIPYQKANVKTFKLELFQLPAGLCCLCVDFIFFYTWILTCKDQIWADHWSEGLRSDVWKRTCQSASRELPKTPGSDTEKGLSGFIQIAVAPFLCS